MPSDKPDLLFGPGSSDGFTASGIAAFDNLSPAAVIRELIQNSLDAARLAGNRPAVVRFRLSDSKLSAIPGINSYMRTLSLAVKTQEELADGQLARQAELVKDRISTTLCEDRVDVLSILDNGIGLNEQRMTALLSDGLSVKGEGATGTYGNGHSTAIPASDLRYILYGGITVDEKRIAAGHAVLASHSVEGEKHVRSSHGYFIRDFQASLGRLYNFETSDNIPKLIKQDLDLIQHNSGHGTAVIITAFNNFLEDDQSLWEMVSHAASANFFVAIAEGELEVHVEDARKRKNPQYQKLGQHNLAETLELHREKKRSKNFLSGLKAFEAYNTFRGVPRNPVSTALGVIDIRLAENPSGVSRVDLCRNGMWITSDLPSFQGKFADRTPFHAVLSLKSDDGGRLHELVRTAEGPLHDTLVAKRLEKNNHGKNDQKDFYSAMREIVEWLKEHTEAASSEAFASDEFLALDFGSDGLGGNSGAKALRGSPRVIGRRPARQLKPIVGEQGEESHEDKQGEKKQKSSVNRGKIRPSLPALVQATSNVTENGRRRMHIEFTKECKNAQLRLVVDEGIDATCDRHGLDPYNPAELEEVTIDGKPVNGDCLERQDGSTVGVRLGDIEQGAAVTVEANVRLNGDFADLDMPSLRIEVFKTPEIKAEAPVQTEPAVHPAIESRGEDSV